MPNLLSETQQKALLMVYLENSLIQETIGDKYPKDTHQLGTRCIPDADQYNFANQLLIQYGLPFQVQDRRTVPLMILIDINQQLIDLIYQYIPGEKLYELLYHIYDQLNAKHQFDFKKGKESSGNKTNESFVRKNKETNRNLIESKRAHICHALEFLMSHYHHNEIKKSRNAALRDTFLFCLFGVTIFFAKLFYHYRLKKYGKNHFFQQMFVESKFLEAFNALEIKPESTAAKIASKLKSIPPMSFVQNNDKKRCYGMIEKNIILSHNPTQSRFPALHPPSSPPVDFKEVIFSNKKRVRKFNICTNTGFETGYGKNGIFLLGTREQIQDSKHKFEEAIQPPLIMTI